MSCFFVDTSALAKRYIAEQGSEWLLSWIEPTAGNTVSIAEITHVEMFSLLARRQREGSLTTENADALQDECLVLPLDSEILQQARLLVTKYPLRSLDAIQLASALQARKVLAVSITFISADNNLLNAASAEGFPIDNPNHYP